MNDENNTTEDYSAGAATGAGNLDFQQAAEAALADAESRRVESARAEDEREEGESAGEAVATPEGGESEQGDDAPVEGDVPAAGEEGAAASAAAALGDTTEEDAEAAHRKRLRDFTKELKKLPGTWYIVQTYAGYENKVKTNLDMRAQTLEVEDSIFEVVVPIEQAVEIKDGKKKTVKRKLLPGYVLVRMDIDDRSWSVVRDTPGVTSFVGNEGNATPVKHREVAKFLVPKEATEEGEATAVNEEGESVVAMPEEESKPKQKIDFEVGEAVTILTGALASVSATISDIDQETGKIQALVSIFGRETPVELTADQVEKLT